VPKSPPSAPAISASRYPTSSLPRIPLVPDDVLKRNNVFCTFDTRFRRAARLLQCLWLKDHNIPTDTTVRQEGETATVIGFASNLHSDAADAGRNFLSQSIHQLVLRELLLREEGAAIDEERLFANALSSMPLTFNLLGPLALDLGLATRCSGGCSLSSSTPSNTLPSNIRLGGAKAASSLMAPRSISQSASLPPMGNTQQSSLKSNTPRT